MAQTPDSSGLVSLLSFDGKDDRVELGKKAQYNIEKDLTLEAWIYSRHNQSKLTGIVSCIYDTGSNESGYGLLLNGKNGVRFALTLSASNRIVYLSTKANVLKLNEWHHIAGTFDGEQMQLYIDGVLTVTKAIASPGICYQPANDLRIGMFRDNNQTYAFDGMIAEVRLWSVARSPAELLRDQAHHLTGNEPGLVGYWQLNEGTGAIVNDKTSHANHGILQGSPSWELSSFILAVPNNVQSKESETMAAPKTKSTSVVPVAPASPASTQLVLSLAEVIAAGSGALKPRDASFTIEAWVYPTIKAGKQVIYSEGESLLYLEDGELKFQTAPAPAIASVGAGIVAGNWYHIAVSRAGNRPGNTKLYINGIQNDNQAAIPSVISVGNTYLGGQPEVPDSRFQGKLLEVRVWRFARSLSEIQANMSYFLTGRELGLIRCWTLNEGFGTTIGDRTTSKATGTIVGDTTWEESEIPIKINLNAQERLTRSTGLEDYGYWFSEMAKQQKTATDPHFRRGRIWA